MWMDVVNTLVSGGLAIIGVLAGAHFTQKISDRETWIRMLAEFYAEVLTNYGIFAADVRNEDKRSRLIASIEKARLVCPEETETRLIALRSAVLKSRESEYAALIHRFRVSASRDVDRLKQNENRAGSTK